MLTQKNSRVYKTISTHTIKEGTNKLIKTPSPVLFCLSAVWCWAGTGQWIYQFSFLLKTSADYYWK